MVRLEDPDLLTGAGKYVDDLDVPGTAHVSFVRSSFAHASLASVDVAAASSMPGVLATYSGDDLGLEPFLLFPMMPPALARPVFAKDRVRFVGDVVAAVVAETRQQAIDAAEAVVVECEALPLVMTAADGLASDAPLLFPEHGSNVCFGTKFGEDVDALEGADVVAEVTMVSQRLLGAPMENNGVLAVPGEPDGGITLWVSHQAPHSARDALAPALGLGPRAAPRGVPVGRRRVRPQGRRVRRVPRGRRRGAGARAAGQVGGHQVGGHAVAGPRARLRDDRRSSA